MNGRTRGSGRSRSKSQGGGRPSRAVPSTEEDATPDQTPSKRFGRFLVATVTALGLIATTTASVAAALWLAAPQLKPREKLGGQLDHIAIENEASYLAYWTDAGRSTGSIGRADLTLKGVYIFVHATLLGFKERTYSVIPMPIDERTNKRIILNNPLTNGNHAVCDGAIPTATRMVLCGDAGPYRRPRRLGLELGVVLKDAGRTAELRPGPLGHQPMLDLSKVSRSHILS